MVIDYIFFNLLVSMALVITSVTPIVLLCLLFLDWKRKDLW